MFPTPELTPRESKLVCQIFGTTGALINLIYFGYTIQWIALVVGIVLLVLTFGVLPRLNYEEGSSWFKTT